MSVSSVRYPVKLQSGQRNFLETIHYLVARVLLMSDQSQGGPSHTDGHIAEVLSISRRTVIRIKQRGCRKRTWK